MNIAPDITAIGFTGAFGSGCTEAAKQLRGERGFKFIQLSAVLRASWAKENGTMQPARFDLQKLGDRLRQEAGLGALVDMALKECSNSDKRIVVDGIRNLGEISRLRDLFGYRFTLVSVLSSPEARWSRLKSRYSDEGLTRDEFEDDD